MTTLPDPIRGFGPVLFAALDPAPLRAVFAALGFTPAGSGPPGELWRQGGVDFVIAAGQRDFAAVHGPGVCGFTLRVEDSAAMLRRAEAVGLTRLPDCPLPAVAGVGGTALILADVAASARLEAEFSPLAPAAAGAGLLEVDHLTHNVARGRMDLWAGRYRRAFDFREIRHFTIAGRHTGLSSRAMASPGGSVRIPVNESTDDRSQIEEFLRRFHGDGIQHIALSTADIHASVAELRRRGIPFLDTPDTYYEALDTRLPGHAEDGARLRDGRILLDGGAAQGGGWLLQIFTDTLVGPLFFEIIQRKGNEGFGEGNFQALFEAIERDQIRRGVLSP